MHRFSKHRPLTLRARATSDARRGLTLVEVVVSTMIVGMMMVLALNTLGAATRSGMSGGNRAVALGIADELMAEILAASYSNLNNYQNLNEQLTGDRAGWRRRATVERVVPTDPTQTAAGVTDLGAKRIRVYVEYENQMLAEQIAVRTDTD